MKITWVWKAIGIVLLFTIAYGIWTKLTGRHFCEVPSEQSYKYTAWQNEYIEYIRLKPKENRTYYEHQIAKTLGLE